MTSEVAAVRAVSPEELDAMQKQFTDHLRDFDEQIQKITSDQDSDDPMLLDSSQRKLVQWKEFFVKTLASILEVDAPDFQRQVAENIKVRDAQIDQLVEHFSMRTTDIAVVHGAKPKQVAKQIVKARQPVYEAVASAEASRSTRVKLREAFQAKEAVTKAVVAAHASHTGAEAEQEDGTAESKVQDVNAKTPVKEPTAVTVQPRGTPRVGDLVMEPAKLPPPAQGQTTTDAAEATPAAATAGTNVDVHARALSAAGTVHSRRSTRRSKSSYSSSRTVSESFLANAAAAKAKAAVELQFLERQTAAEIAAKQAAVDAEIAAKQAAVDVQRLNLEKEVAIAEQTMVEVRQLDQDTRITLDLPETKPVDNVERYIDSLQGVYRPQPALIATDGGDVAPVAIEQHNAPQEAYTPTAVRSPNMPPESTNSRSRGRQLPATPAQRTLPQPPRMTPPNYARPMRPAAPLRPMMQPKGYHRPARHSYGPQPSRFDAPAQYPSQQDLIQVLVDQTYLSRIPVVEPPVFAGDPLKFADWLKSFQTLVEQRAVRNEDRLHYLKRYLSGEEC